MGTRFSVGISDDGQTQVRLHEGKVTVRAANHVASDSAAPVQARVGDDIRRGVHARDGEPGRQQSTKLNE